MNKRKILALSIVALLFMHLYGTISIVSFYRAFANTETYSVTNTIYFNSTTLGTSRVFKIEITETPKEVDTSVPFKADDYEGGFSPDVAKQSIKLTGIDERQELSVQNYNFLGKQLNFSNTAFGFATVYINGTVGVNSSDYYANFERVVKFFPTTEKLILFDSPLNYVQEYCDKHGLTLDSIINSTYTENIDTGALNLFKSELAKTDYLVTEDLPTYDEVKASNSGLAKYGADLLGQKPEHKFIFLFLGLAAIAITACICVPAITDAIVDCKRIQATKEMAINQIWADANVSITSINAEKEVQLALTENKAENEQMILDAYINGTISFEECLTLLKLTGNSYDNLLSNRTQNFNEFLENYFSHVEEQWDDYKHGLGIGTSWLNWIYYIVILCVVGFALYIVYALFIKKSNNASQLVVVK